MNILDQKSEKKLLQIGYKWADFAKIPNEAIKDIILVGGNANYNYTRFSDLDLHLVVDKTQIADCPEILDDYLRDKKKLWALVHDIKFILILWNCMHRMRMTSRNQGVFSVANDEWIMQPRRTEVNLSDPLLFKKFVLW